MMDFCREMRDYAARILKYEPMAEYMFRAFSLLLKCTRISFQASLIFGPSADGILSSRWRTDMETRSSQAPTMSCNLSRLCLRLSLTQPAPVRSYSTRPEQVENAR